MRECHARAGTSHRPARATLIYTCVYILALVVGVLAPVPAAAQEEGGLTVERIFDGSLFEDLPSGVRWVGDGKGISYKAPEGDEEDSPTVFFIRSVPSGKTRAVCVPDTATVPEDLADSEETTFRIGAYTWDEDGKRICFTFAGELFTMDAKNGRIERRTWTDGSESDPTFSPDGKRIAFTRDNDIHVVTLEDNEEVQLTTTGSDSVLNGILDWVYMEELFTRGNVRAFWWSPDSERIAFLQIQEHPVPEFPLVDFIPLHGKYKLQHYPKAGDPNPIVRVGMVEADGGAITWANTDTSDDSYIARVYWLGDSRGVAIEKLNRAQDQLTLLFADANSGALEEVLDESSDTWVNVNYLKHYYEKKRQFVWGSERNGHSHLYLYNLDGSLKTQLTDGEWQVTSVNGVDEKKGKVYFTANKDDVRERHLYVVDDDGKNLTRITEEPGNHSALLSPDFKYYIDYFSSESRPTTVSVHDVHGKRLFKLGDSQSEELAAIKRPLPEFMTITSEEGLEYYCMITKPLDFDPSRKYPVIVYTYGGPHSQVVRRAWSRHNLWHSMMAERGFIVFSLDNRGSFGRGKAWEDWVLKDMGNYELQDQLVGVEWLKSQPYVDGDNIGIWGWSYGGYMTLYALFKAPDLFKAGSSVAPVTDWRLYDSIYTERYMKRPQDNEDGYHSSAPLNFVEDFKGHLLLMHGDADDNVHMQNSIKLVQKLVEAGKQFDLMIYPQKFHGISGEAYRTHLYTKMTEFFERHLKGNREKSYTQ